jgi:hypothetical protein
MQCGVASPCVTVTLFNRKCQCCAVTVSVLCCAVLCCDVLQVADHILNNPADKTKVSLVFANVSEGDILLKVTGVLACGVCTINQVLVVPSAYRTFAAGCTPHLMHTVYQCLETRSGSLSWTCLARHCCSAVIV